MSPNFAVGGLKCIYQFLGENFVVPGVRDKNISHGSLPFDIMKSKAAKIGDLRCLVYYGLVISRLSYSTMMGEVEVEYDCRNKAN